MDLLEICGLYIKISHIILIVKLTLPKLRKVLNFVTNLLNFP